MDLTDKMTVIKDFLTGQLLYILNKN